jgi:hypothetical protein
MPAMVCEYKGYRVAIYSPSLHFAVITAPGSNRVLDLQEKQPRSTVVDGPLPGSSQGVGRRSYRRRATKGHRLRVNHAAA